jgi:hypothetical protein
VCRAWRKRARGACTGELERLKRERLAHRVRMQSLLVTQGLTERAGAQLGSLA